jgi:hypothetical protein
LRPSSVDTSRVGDRHGEDAVLGDGRRAVYRRRDILPPDDLAVGRIERQHLRIAGRDVETVVPEGRPAAEGAAAHSLGF